MRCSCGGETYVVDTASDDNKTYRLRRCKKCGKRIGTVESEVHVGIASTKINMIKAERYNNRNEQHVVAR